MTLEQSILDVVRELPYDKQQELLEHAERLKAENSPKRKLKSIEGLWAGQGISISAEEIDEAQKEIWKNFPRDDI